jgi:hypothetical protein
MKVKVEMVVYVDTESWTMNYGVEGAKEIREDVKSWATNGIRDQMVELGLWDREGEG